MPIYDFRCRECGQVTELLVLNTNAQEVKCPECGGSMEKLISSSFLIKADRPSSGGTCCGRSERCEFPPCSGGEECRRH